MQLIRKKGQEENGVGVRVEFRPPVLSPVACHLYPLTEPAI
jgi:hypothetical protein